MPATQPKGYKPPPPTPHLGAWTQDNGQWKWDPQGTPNRNLVDQYGDGAITDVRQDPGGTLNYGAWTPVRGGGWQWTWGAKPNPNLVDDWGEGALTDPGRTPHGGGGTALPPPPDVVPPDVVDSWGGVAPSVTGELPPPPDGSSQTVSQPPSHPAYAVSPGSIRNAENVLLGQIDAEISQYNDLRAFVESASSSNIYTDGATRFQLLNAQHNLLMSIGDALQLAGQFVSMLNYSAQNYAHADIGSFVPEE